MVGGFLNEQHPGICSESRRSLRPNPATTNLTGEPPAPPTGPNATQSFMDLPKCFESPVLEPGPNGYADNDN